MAKIKAYNLRHFNRLKLQSAEEVERNIKEYLDSCGGIDGRSLDEGRAPTVVGLANALGITKKTLEDYWQFKGSDLPSVETLEEHVEECKKSIKTREKRLSFTQRRATYIYLDELKEALELRYIINAISYGYSIIEEFNSEELYDKGHKGAVFTLKNVYGYTDKSEIEITTAKKFEDFMDEGLNLDGDSEDDE